MTKKQLDADIRKLTELLDQEQWGKACVFAAANPHLLSDAMHSISPFEGMPFLNVAADSGAFHCVKVFVECGAPLEGRSPDGATPLLHALRHLDDVPRQTAYQRTIEYLFHHHARADVVDDTGESPVYQAFAHIDADLAERLIELGTPLNGTWHVHQDHSMQPSITAAAAQCAPGHETRRAVLQLLVRSGADLNPPARTVLDQPLAQALRHGDVAMADFMVEHGAQWRAVSPEGQSLMFAAGSAASMHWLLDRDPGLLDRPDHRGRTPLLYHLAQVAHASLSKRPPNTDIVCALVLAGADVDAVDHQGPQRCATPRRILSSGPDTTLKDFWRSHQAARVAAATLEQVLHVSAILP